MPVSRPPSIPAATPIAKTSPPRRLRGTRDGAALRARRAAPGDRTPPAPLRGAPGCARELDDGGSVRRARHRLRASATAGPGCSWQRRLCRLPARSVAVGRGSSRRRTGCGRSARFSIPPPTSRPPPLMHAQHECAALQSPKQGPASPGSPTAASCRPRHIAEVDRFARRFRRRRRALRRRALSLGRQNAPRRRLLGAAAGGFAGGGQRLPARQRHAAGRARPKPDGATILDGLERGDLVFWKGHVGIMTDGFMLLHANAHHMAAIVEPVRSAVERIARAGLPISSLKRLREASVASTPQR